MFFVLLFVGVCCLSALAISSTRFHPSCLGLDRLTLIIFTSFLVSALHTGFTFRRLLLLLIPAAGGLFLRQQMAAYSPNLFDPIDWTLFQRSVYAEVGYLWLLFVWITAFPARTDMPDSDDVSRAVRLTPVDWLAVAMVGISLGYQTVKIVLQLRTEGGHGLTVPYDFFVQTQPVVSLLYLFLLLRLFLSIAPAQRQANRR